MPTKYSYLNHYRINTMQYMSLTYAAENAGPDYGTPKFGELLEAYGTFSKKVHQAGVLVAGEALQVRFQTLMNTLNE